MTMLASPQTKSGNISKTKTLPLIRVSDVHKSFKKNKAVTGVSFEIYSGEYIALLGPNGAGKTTVVEMIEGITMPDRGHIFVAGMEWKKARSQISQILGISLQETKFIDKLKCIEILSLFASFYHIQQEHHDALLNKVGLSKQKNSLIETLSGGQKQKLALAAAIIHEPKILILDEPTTGLDPNARRDIWDILISLKSKGTTLLLTTHYMEEAEKLCDKILIMDSGKILSAGTLTELVSKHDQGEIIELRTHKRPTSLENKLAGVKSSHWDESQRKLKLIVNSINKTLPLLLEGTNQEKVEILEIDCRKMTLDDLFTQMTGKKLDA